VKELAPPLRCLIHDDAAVHDHRDTARAPALGGVSSGIDRQCEQGNVENARPTPLIDDLAQ
jgi:hypothetical protein